ncbi:hypothetical protein PUN28_017214 [Cardiocondyla obscurior]|uniref:Secreted protein n=1 Tax=Cardiocondyla obscurior TaxID=286306 RepID=A0AAW2EM10_9HYME
MSHQPVPFFLVLAPTTFPRPHSCRFALQIWHTGVSLTRIRGSCKTSSHLDATYDQSGHTCYSMTGEYPYNGTRALRKENIIFDERRNPSSYRWDQLIAKGETRR